MTPALASLGFRPGPKGTIRVLFPLLCDEDVHNAQSLNERELARRFEPVRFRSTLLVRDEPDPRLLGRDNIGFVHLPSRGGVISVARELSRHDVVFNITTLPRVAALFGRSPTRLLTRAKLVQWVEAPVQPDRDSQAWALARAAATRAAAVVAISEQVADTMRRHWETEPTAVIPVGVDPAVFAPGAPCHQASHHDEECRVVFVGHLDQRKNPSLVIEAARRWAATNFMLVGAPKDTGLAMDLERQVRLEQLTNVEFVRPRGHFELAKLLAESDILFHPATSEGLPKVVLEASACGLPVVLMRRHASPAVVDGVTGFHAGNTRELFEFLGRLIADASLRRRMGRAAALHSQAFGWDGITRLWEAVIEAAVRAPAVAW